MRICAYVQTAYAKETYANECMDSRQFFGLRVVIDALERKGYEVEYAGAATVHLYDVVLVSITADCDWWSYVRERTQWQPGSYKVIIGGAGVLHVVPWLPYGDYFVLGRGERTVPLLVDALAGKSVDLPDSIITASDFDVGKRYTIEQTDAPYPHAISVGKREVTEGAIGCNHRCTFCGYTWHRRFLSSLDRYGMVDRGFENVEMAMLDMAKDPASIDFAHLRTTAIDGMSERLRRMVNKRITREMMTDFIVRMIESPAKPHQIKFYNIVGCPTETMDDWQEYLDTLRDADARAQGKDKQWSIVLHSTPFRAMPATPMACAPMSLRNYRGEIGGVLGKGLKGNLIYQGRSLWSVESMGTESLCTVMLSAIAHCGSEADTENARRVACSRAFWRASSAQREATLAKYFDMGRLFGVFTAETLPSRYLRTYCKVERAWK